MLEPSLMLRLQWVYDVDNPIKYFQYIQLCFTSSLILFYQTKGPYEHAKWLRPPIGFKDHDSALSFELANSLRNLTLPIDWIGLKNSKFHRLLRELGNP